MRRLLFLVSVIVLVDTMFYAAITPLLPDYADRFDLSKSAAGVLAGAYAAGTLLGALPGGLFAARLGARRAVLVGVALMSVASVGFAFGDSDVTRFVQGIGAAFSFAGGFGWLLAQAPTANRGAMIGTAMSAAVGGSLLGPVVGAVARATGPELPFGAIAVLGVVLFLCALRIPAVPPVGGSVGPAFRRALSAPRVRGGMVLVTVPALGFGTINVLGALELDELGAGGFGIGATFLVAAAIQTVVQTLAGRASDRVGRRPLLLRSLAGSSVCVLLLVPPSGVWLFAVSVVVALVVVGSLYTPAMALLSDGAAGAGLDQGMAFALVNLTWAGGQVLGAVAGSGLAEATSDAVPFVLLSAVMALSLVALVRRPVPAVV
ncbi:MFS transporter [Conexibacter stalactiti]|uniref:MFS transporter n=1 Tax=Conexibacter stalactiti TaxID=1940611 RepID=A0ABU4HLN9_9ACTN|nr:MFS transporter [Conexibacter stalactiti]MDW5593480.1 MFS transporter [Conexibacter stalactiti]MEC5034121.1 MFS transporter [Conexibacter stalactiti]